MKNPAYTFLLFAVFMMVLCCNVQAQRITTTIAGTGSSAGGYSGVPSRSAATLMPINVKCSGRDIFVSNGGTIRKISGKTGIITLIGGGGSSVAEGIPATNAAIVALDFSTDALGNIYISDSFKVRKIDAVTNLVRTIAGTGIPGYTGDGGPATSASFGVISGIAADNNGNVYVADQANNRIRKISLASGIITSIAGGASAGYTGDLGPATAALISSPKYVCTNDLGDVYFGDQAVHYFRKISASTGIITTVVGGGSCFSGCSGTSTNLGNITGIACDIHGNIIFDEDSCQCRRWNVVTDMVEALCGNAIIEGFTDDTVSQHALMCHEKGLCADVDDNIYIADWLNSRIRKSVPVLARPTFAFGPGQSIKVCRGYSTPIDSVLWITDLDTGQTETWSIIAGPTHGLLAGFPATSTSIGLRKTLKPTGLFYSSLPSYIGTDSFSIRISDGLLYDTITVFVSVQAPPTETISGPSTVCQGSTIGLIPEFPGGVWWALNSIATVDPMSGIVTGASGGVDTIIHTIYAECPINAPKIVTVNPLPATGTIVGGDTVCLGGLSTFTSTATGGIWTSLSPSIVSIGLLSGIASGLTIGAATIKYTTTALSCSAYTTKTVNVFSPDAGLLTGPDSVCVGASVSLASTVTGGVWSTSASGLLVGSTSGVVTGISAGTFANITYTVIGGPACVSHVNHFVSVVPYSTPDAGTISGIDFLCEGLSTSLMTSVPGGTWNVSNANASVSFLGAVTGIHVGGITISYTVANACTSATVSKDMEIKPTPDAGVITGDDSVCVGATTSLTNAVPGGSWTLSNVNASVLDGKVLGIFPGSVDVFYSVSNLWCSDIAAKTIVVSDCGPIQLPDNISSQSIRVFPNPTATVLRISIPTAMANQVTAHIKNVAGQTVFESAVESSVSEIDVSKFAKGIYTLTLFGGGVFIVEKITVVP